MPLYPSSFLLDRRYAQPQNLRCNLIRDPRLPGFSGTKPPVFWRLILPSPLRLADANLQKPVPILDSARHYAIRHQYYWRSKIPAWNSERLVGSLANTNQPHKIYWDLPRIIKPQRLAVSGVFCCAKPSPVNEKTRCGDWQFSTTGNVGRTRW